MLSTSSVVRAFPRLVRSSSRGFHTTELHSSKLVIRPASTIPISKSSAPSNVVRTRGFRTSSTVRGLMPETENPKPREAEPIDQIKEATPLSNEEYHELADAYLETLENKVEEMQESRSDIELEFAAGVLTITTPKGVYVLNKQPPNKQIWLSSPVSGPKRYDWAVFGESIDHKEGSGRGDWVYIRDGSSLSSLLKQEIGLDVGAGGDVAP